jgi:hypothetical protein
MFMQVDVALISSSSWACEIGEVEGPRGFGIYRHLSIYLSRAESIDGIFDGKTVTSQQEIQECQGLIRAGDD